MTAATAAAVAALIAALLFGHAVDGSVLPGIPEPGALTEWALPTVTMLANLLGVLTAGLTVTAAFLLPGDGNSVAAYGWLVLRRTIWLALSWALCALGLIFLTVSGLLGTPLPRLTGQAVLGFAFSVAQGQALLAQAVLALAVAALTGPGSDGAPPRSPPGWRRSRCCRPRSPGTPPGPATIRSR